jgi:hypothetical protein
MKNQPTFRRDISPPSSKPKNKQRKEPCVTADGKKRYVPPKRRVIFYGTHGVVSQKIELFIMTAVRTLNPTNQYMFFMKVTLSSIPRQKPKIQIICFMHQVSLKTKKCFLKRFLMQCVILELLEMKILSG